MKRIIFACCICVLSISSASSQDEEDHFIFGDYSKMIENNLTMNGTNFNIKNKSNIEKLFFGDFNALIEFCYMPSSEINPCIPSGFRIIRDSLKSAYILEVKRVSNYREASEEASKEAKKAQKRQLIDIPVRLLDSLPKDVLNQIWEYNKNISNTDVFLKMYYELLPKYFTVEIKSISISNEFAEKLYKMMVSFIDDFKAKGIPLSTVDGYSVSFRTVVADEVWSLGIHMPTGNANTVVNLCMKIILDTTNDQLEESTYLSVLENL